jgi:hypothetical protein
MKFSEEISLAMKLNGVFVSISRRESQLNSRI